MCVMRGNFSTQPPLATNNGPASSKQRLMGIPMYRFSANRVRVTCHENERQILLCKEVMLFIHTTFLVVEERHMHLGTRTRANVAFQIDNHAISCHLYHPHAIVSRNVRAAGVHDLVGLLDSSTETS